MTSDSGNRNAGALPNSPPARLGLKPSASSPLERLAAALRDKYQIHRELGRGGSAFVYLATDLRIQREVAIKVLRPEVTVALSEARFQREIEIAGQLQHPNVLSLLEVGSADGQLYFTMPFITGETLRERIKRDRQMRLYDAIAIARSVANALDYAHAQGIVHRDIKPANILLEPSNTLVADFGIARAMRIVTGDQITDSGVVIGTPEYMSPEQGTGERTIDGRSDVYALGCVVYEMIAGEPPFTGPTAQAVIARHCQESPRSIHVIRPSIPRGVERAIERALAKVPADRFESAAQFVDALESGIDARTDVFGLTRLTRRSRTVLGGSLIALTGAVAWTAVQLWPPALDSNLVVVFPLYEAAARNASAGEEVATFIGHALDGTRPLKWKDGWELLDRSQHTTNTRLDAGVARLVSRKAGAGFFIDGSIIRRPDSVSVLLRLNSVAGDSAVRLVQRSRPAASAALPQLGLEAVRAILPDLVAPGGRIDLAQLSDRRPEAVANFLQGEREYRRMQFGAALPHYRAAIRDDSAFSLAALRGAYAAMWLSDAPAAAEIVQAALGPNAALTPAQTLVTRALHAYIEGVADSAIINLQRALRVDSAVHGAWTLLGEVYSRLASREWRADSLARLALERARVLDRDFSPTLLLLEEMALRDGDARRAAALSEELRAAGADTTHSMSRQLMLRCIQAGPLAVDWRIAVVQDPLEVLGAAKVLGGRAAQPQCAIAAFRVLLGSTTIQASIRAAALIGLEAQLTATGQTAEAEQALTLRSASDVPRRTPILLAASTSPAFASASTAIADTAASAYGQRPATTLWLLADYETRRGNIERVRAIARTINGKADSTRSVTDKRLAAGVDARLRLLEGDTARAIDLLRFLDVSSSRYNFGWIPSASLASEHMLLAKVLFARGRFEDARRAASLVDATEPLANPFYIRESLALRWRAAIAMNDTRLAEQYRRRQERLDRCCKGGS